MATTPTYALEYPTNYSSPADAPAALEDLALSAETALTAIDGRVAERAKVTVAATAPTSPQPGDIWVEP